MLSAGERQYEDWSAAYRLFENARIDTEALFTPAIDRIVRRQTGDEPVYAMMDDTLIRKRGKKVHGASWKRDPLGPPFHTNFVWGQRYLQISAAMPDGEVHGRARGIPVDFHHAPVPNKPRKQAPKDEWVAYDKAREACKISALGAERLRALRDNVPREKTIICAVDGGFTNSTVLRNLPENVVLVGRIRKDARLFDVPPEETVRRGRKRYYGNALPTPEHIRQDESIPWEEVTAFAAGACHKFQVKSLPAVRWKATGDRDIRLLVIRPLAYRPRKGAKLLYRDPAYLICTDPLLPLAKVIQAYLWRWEIELNFRDEKTVLGVGHAQVRVPAAVRSVPALIVASYAFLLLAASSGLQQCPRLPSPKWYPRKSSDRCSTQEILAFFRAQLWRIAFDSNKTHFVSSFRSHSNHSFFHDSLHSAVCFARF